MGEGQIICVESQTAHGIRLGSVFVVPGYRMTQFGQMDSDLVLAPSVQLYIQ